MINLTKGLSNIFLNVTINNIQKQMMYGISRTLYTNSALHLDKYIRSRKIVHEMFRKSNPKLFKVQMAKLVADEKSIINLDDIYTFCFIINQHPEDINLLNKIVHKTFIQSNTISNDHLKQVGTQVMLTLHYIKDANLALKMFMNPQYDNLFCLHVTYIIILDLLYESNKFKEVRQVYDKIRSSKTSDGNKFIKHASPLIAISCYKENSPESLEYILEIYENLRKKNIASTKVTAAIGILAINQKAPDVALRLMKSLNRMNATCVCIEIMALADLDQLDDLEQCLKLIRNTSNIDLHCLSVEIIPKIEDAIKRAGIDSTSKISHYLNDIKKSGYIRKSIFDAYLLSSIKKERIL